MGIQDEVGATAAETQFCATCGNGLSGGRFCPGCGQPAGTAGSPFPRFDAANDAAAAYVKTGAPLPATARKSLLTDIEETARLTAEPVPVSSGLPVGTRKAGSRWPVWAAGGLLIVAIGVVAVILLTGGSSSNSSGGTASYTSKVVAAFQPVNHANQQLSTALAGLNGQRTGAARAAVAQGQSATSAARTALAALPAPDASQQLPILMRQVLDSEDTYLAAVSAALAHPGSPGVGQLSALAGTLVRSLDAVGAPLAGAAQNVSGADTLTTWAQGKQRAKRAAARRAAANKRASAANVPATGAAPASALPAPASSPSPTGQDCGGGLFAGANTTCPFARNVQQAYYDAGGGATTLDVPSPVTHQSYTMSCQPVGGGVTCAGGNNASLSW
jgi:hypothetical protein